MSKRRDKLEEWKTKLVGNIFTFLTITDIIQRVDKNNKKKYFAVCLCKCGNICYKNVYDVARNHTKSCGCYVSSKENSELHRGINLNKHNEMSRARKKWCEEHRDIVKYIGARRSKWCKSNPDKLKEAAYKYSEWCKNNPDKVKEINFKISKWYKDNPGKTRELHKRQQAWREDKERVREAREKYINTINNNPDILINAGKKISQWYKDNSDFIKYRTELRHEYFIKNPDKLEELSEKIKQWFKDNPEQVSQFRDAHQIKFIEGRLNTDYSKLIEIIHPSFIEQLLDGKLSQSCQVLTRCPRCGNYDTHSLRTIFTLHKEDFRTGYAPLCKQCTLSNTTSNYEKEIADYISSFYIGTCIRNDREILKGKELDLYYPEKSIAVEFNGDYWHSEEFKQKDYHYNKFKLCRDNNILLVSIFESEWLNFKNDIKIYLKDIFDGKNSSLSYNKKGYMNNNYPAINCVIKKEVLEDYYMYKSKKVYTCGYSKLSS